MNKRNRNIANFSPYGIFDANKRRNLMSLAGQNALGIGAGIGTVAGGIGGALSAPSDSSLQDRLGRAALGAGVGAGAGAGAAYGGGKLKTFLDKRKMLAQTNTVGNVNGRAAKNAAMDEQAAQVAQSNRATLPDDLEASELAEIQRQRQALLPGNAGRLNNWSQHIGATADFFSSVQSVANFSMKRGYRLSAGNAYFNYRQNQIANFNDSSMWDRAKNAGSYLGSNVDNAAQAIGVGVGNNLNAAGNYLPNRMMLDPDSRVAKASNAVSSAGSRLATGMGKAKWARRALGYGGLAAAGAGAIGLGAAGYNALTGGNRNQQMQ